MLRFTQTRTRTRTRTRRLTYQFCGKGGRRRLALDLAEVRRGVQSFVDPWSDSDRMYMYSMRGRAAATPGVRLIQPRSFVHVRVPVLRGAICARGPRAVRSDVVGGAAAQRFGAAHEKH